MAGNQMKKVLLICPSNKLFMPYLSNYTNILDMHNISYDTVIWNRMGFNEETNFVFTDKRKSHRKSFLSYLKYSLFIKNILKNQKYDRIVVFGLQLTFFLKNVLLSNYKNRYIIDIRDYNKILKFSNLRRVLNHAHFVVISSPKYRSWLPEGNNYILNHNMSIDSFDTAIKKFETHKHNYNISYIGTIVNLKMNIMLIEEFKNSDLFELRFIGAGIINDDIKKHIEDNNIKNVKVIGKYEKYEEASYYCSSDFINMLMQDNRINSTVLSNRLYNAALYGVPLIAIKGSLISDIIKEYNLGLVVDEICGLSERMCEYINLFDEDGFLKGRSEFLNEVINTNSIFNEKLIRFAGNGACSDSDHKH